ASGDVDRVEQRLSVGRRCAGRLDDGDRREQLVAVRPWRPRRAFRSFRSRRTSRARGPLVTGALLSLASAATGGRRQVVADDVDQEVGGGARLSPVVVEVDVAGAGTAGREADGHRVRDDDSRGGDVEAAGGG